jgi:predicted dehydrogenase
MLRLSIVKRFPVLSALVLILAGSASLQPQAYSQQSPRFRIAVLGLVHSHAWGPLRNMAKNSNLEVVGIADVNPELRELAAKELPGVPLYEDYLKLLDEKKPEGAWSFVENDRHLEITKACAARGVHLIFEKPMAATFQQASQMLEIAQKSKIKLMVNYQMAWWPANYAAFDFAKTGDIGKVWRVRSVIGHGGPAPSNPADVRGQIFWKWLNDEKRGGGALIDFTCYGAVWLRWYLGMPKSVYAITTHTRPDVYKTNTSATVLAAFSDNGVGIIEGSWDLPRSFQDVEVFGEKGSVYMTQRGIEAFVGRDKKEVAISPLEETRRDPIGYFVNAVRSGKPIEGMVSPEFNLDVMRIVDAIRLSAEKGTPVFLEPKSGGK